MASLIEGTKISPIDKTVKFNQLLQIRCSENYVSCIFSHSSTHCRAYKYSNYTFIFDKFRLTRNYKPEFHLIVLSSCNRLNCQWKINFFSQKGTYESFFLLIITYITIFKKPFVYY